MIKRLLSVPALLLIISCGRNSEEPRVMTRQGPLEAEIRRADATYQRISENSDMTIVSLSGEEVRELKTEFAFWRTADLYLEEGKLAMAKLGAREQDNGKFEEFFFDKKGNLVMAKEGSQEDVKSYYFVIDKLVLVLKNGGDTIKTNSSGAKFNSINLVKEASKLKALVKQ